MTTEKASIYAIRARPKLKSAWCACPGRVIDLYRGAFSQLADPSVGILKVEVSW